MANQGGIEEPPVPPMAGTSGAYPSSRRGLHAAAVLNRLNPLSWSFTPRMSWMFLLRSGSSGFPSSVALSGARRTRCRRRCPRPENVLWRNCLVASLIAMTTERHRGSGRRPRHRWRLIHKRHIIIAGQPAEPKRHLEPVQASGARRHTVRVKPELTSPTPCN